MDENELTKTELWTGRIKEFYTSGLSRKEWCQKPSKKRVQEAGMRVPPCES